MYSQPMTRFGGPHHHGPGHHPGHHHGHHHGHHGSGFGPLIPFLTGLAISPFLFGGPGGGYGPGGYYGPQYGPYYDPYYGGPGW
ncbi:hypothetical protein ACJ2A9_16425 [Anaerobacillus sp. MEB173]|uniref:hypothetical protein n=1 Tax=Anaerobacillus sp. MEB173 TaxID=3383345 RepID=UPI003F8EF723